MDVLDLSGDPVDRLVAGRREFGEFGGVNASVEISTTFTVLEAEKLPAIFNGDFGPEKGGCYVYGRAFNPTVRHLGRLLAALEGCEAAYPCSSGMAAISSTLLALCNSGDHIVASNTVYGGTHALLKTFLPAKAAITTSFVDITDLAAVRAALQEHPGRVKVLYTEVVSNPTLAVADLRALADLAHSAGAALVVDNTFTPFVVTPRRFGADVVIHSLTKFVSGASDIIAGAVCGSAAFIRSLMDFHAGPCMLLGPTMDPRVASELTLRLPHLALRMQEHGRRAAAFASRLAALGAAVRYPGLPQHPQHALMAAQANPGYGFGGVMGLDLGTPARANAFMERLQNRHGFGFMAVSLGYFDTLMSLSAASTSSELSEADMAASGIARGYVRMSVGITATLEERWRQLEEAYRFTMKLGPAAEVPYRAVKLRRTPSGAVEQLISWPSMGCGDGESLGGGGAAAAANGGGYNTVTTAAVPPTSIASVVEVLAEAATAAAAEAAAASGAAAEVKGAGKAAAGGDRVGEPHVPAVNSRPLSTPVTASPFTAGPAAHPASGGGGGGSSSTASAGLLGPQQPPPAAQVLPPAAQVLPSGAQPHALVSGGGCLGACGEGKGLPCSSCLHRGAAAQLPPPHAHGEDGPSKRRQLDAVVSEARGSGGAGGGGVVWPAVKIRRTGSSEIHYVVSAQRVPA
ncbi:hypothetical protein Agub_g2116 [Astrephomene gubernaculifera]|uniref:Methionine gamma-lyase n=1 Tax=Astrephomene gubernaculifera TaxID=47775 RepID=A0AAD3DGJ7_9CHLO|nr:hypothetical protein Agub_g2116 [Astrephomene gubernaculifera]